MIGFAHRGSPALYQRENTLAAFRRALASGARGLESDVWLTADGVPVLHHDGVLGPPGRRRPIGTLAVDRLPSWLPTLAAFYRALDASFGLSFELSLDLKGPDEGFAPKADAIVAVAREAGGSAAASRLWLCGHLPQLAAYRARDPDVQLVNSASLAAVQGGGGPAAYAEKLRAAGIAALNLRSREWTPRTAGIAEVLHEREVAAFGWDAQRTATLRRLAGYGLDAVYSDHVDRLVQVTGRRPGASAPVSDAPGTKAE
ncbi:Glycerophosphoryl diester phosphodiesterase [Frankia sp. AiPs1]|uniref:glycerophosphodiester phosphodiesterase n=1 Tax=Frankia sp. AiPa1 TaxID=573492 RepID=UPI00202B8FC3|nr:glycerophosphodiester phosphodiesterase [Frankia sp. AiPa1]MCL9758408.1 glycerophosphodiester phosphodiesterase [Frankia sp. AiPa1]